MYKSLIYGDREQAVIEHLYEFEGLHNKIVKWLVKRGKKKVIKKNIAKFK